MIQQLIITWVQWIQPKQDIHLKVGIHQHKMVPKYLEVMENVFQEQDIGVLQVDGHILVQVK